MKMKLLNFLLLAAVLLAYAFLDDKASIEGKITEADTGSPLSFAYIKLFQGGKLITGTQSNVDGNYMIKDIDPGTYSLVSVFLGYTSNTKPDYLINAGNATQFAMAVAEFGMLLRNSEYKQNASYKNVLELAELATKNTAIKDDADGNRSEFIKLVKPERDLSNELSAK